jgi:hypothetical protein
MHVNVALFPKLYDDLKSLLQDVVDLNLFQELQKLIQF